MAPLVALGMIAEDKSIRLVSLLGIRQLSIVECGLLLILSLFFQNPNVSDEAKEHAERILQENDAM